MGKRITILIVSIIVASVTTIDLQAQETNAIRTVSGIVTTFR
ncbi:hypothetical protein SDC9_64993 [bioreactor metagenome]|uniref:Uncharacterized protein n=1 Tax=bioreactor metagenome TaxID=1076179 RepID=A0A644XQR5_9ZZZZ